MPPPLCGACALAPTVRAAQLPPQWGRHRRTSAPTVRDVWASVARQGLGPARCTQEELPKHLYLHHDVRKEYLL